MITRLKLNFYGYYLEEGNTRYRSDIRPLLRQYVQTKDRPTFRRVGSREMLFLSDIPLVQDCYILIQSSDSELIKAVDIERSTHKDIMEKLENNEKIGFAAILYVQPSFFGIVKTVKGPGDKALKEWLHQAFAYIGREKLQVQCYMFPTHTTKEEIQRFSTLRSAYIRINKDSKMLRGILPWFFGKEPQKLQCFDITIKPTLREDLPEIEDMVLNQIDLEDGVELLKIRAKDHADDAINDYFLVGEGHISELVVKASELDMAKEIISRTGHSKAKIERGIQNEERINAPDKNDRSLFSSISFSGGPGGESDPPMAKEPR